MDFFKIFVVSKFFVFIFKGDGANAKNFNGLSGDRSYRSRGSRFEFSEASAFFKATLSEKN